MIDKADAKFEYLTAILKEVEQADVFFGAHRVAVTSAHTDMKFPGMLLCSTVARGEVAIDADHITAILATPG